MPEIRVHISTRNNGIVDISDDLVQGSMTIRTNGVHTFNFQLQNAQRKYDRVIQPMDRISVEMKRVTWVRVFSGYLNNGPIFSAWPRVLTLMASCTLKRLQFWYWDTTTDATIQLLDKTLGTGRNTPAAATTTVGPNGGAPATPDTTATSFDQAATQTLINILTQVVQWPQEKIHVAALPGNWTSLAAAFGEQTITANDLTSMFGDFTSTAGLDAVIGAAALGNTGGAVGGAIAGTPLNSGGSIPAGSYGGTPLNSTQVGNAQLIAQIAAQRGLPTQAAVIGIATALQESSLNNLSGGDRDSAGLFQQRPSAGWGTYAQVTNPTYATNAFYDALVKVPGWQNLSVTEAAQAVQRSAYPNAYAKWTGAAQALVGSFNNSGTPAAGTAAPLPGNNVTSNTAANNATTSPTTGSTTGAEPIARAVDNSLISIYQWGLQPFSVYGDVLGGERALMNDEPILPYIANLMASCMRSFCSAPNGDFISWFPDYFGIWNTAGKMNIEPIELMDFTVEWNDQEIVTHQYVVGAPNAVLDVQSATATATPDSSGYNWAMSTSGIATADMPGIFALLFQSDPGSQYAADYLRRFGGRPNLVTMPLIAQGLPELVMAVYLFMQRWANQFNANVPMTFMPELWPGMLLCIPAYNFQAYITEVNHTFQFGKDGGFYTSAKICAPARTTTGEQVSSLFGLLPVAGSARPDGSATTSGNTGTGTNQGSTPGTQGSTNINDIPTPGN